MPSCSQIASHRPNKKDRVRVVRVLLDEHAQYLGCVGHLIALDSQNEGIIKLDTMEVVVMDVACIGKLGAQ